MIKNNFVLITRLSYEGMPEPVVPIQLYPENTADKTMPLEIINKVIAAYLEKLSDEFLWKPDERTESILTFVQHVLYQCAGLTIRDLKYPRIYYSRDDSVIHRDASLEVYIQQERRYS